MLANLANLWQFAEVLPSKCFSYTIQIACKSKFANILPSKVKEMCIRQYFTPPNISHVRY